MKGVDDLANMFVVLMFGSINSETIFTFLSGIGLVLYLIYMGRKIYWQERKNKKEQDNTEP